MKFTKEQLEKAMACKSVEELLALAEAEGIALTREEAEKYLAQFGTRELSMDELEGVSGGAPSDDIDEFTEGGFHRFC